MCRFVAIMALITLNTAWAAVDEIAFEAEDADQIQPPMMIVEDKGASGGKAIVSNVGRQGWAIYEIEIPKANTYYMWGHVIAPDGVSDSFFVTFDEEERGNDNGNPNIWDVAQGVNWHWDQVDGRGVGIRQFKLDEGVHVLKIWTRENNTKLDAIFMSTDMIAQPKLPGEDPKVRDRKTAGRIAVRPGGKLTALWGELKRGR